MMIIMMMIITIMLNCDRGEIGIRNPSPENPDVQAASNTATKPAVVFICLSPPSLPLVDNCAIDTPTVRMTSDTHCVAVSLLLSINTEKIAVVRILT